MHIKIVYDNSGSMEGNVAGICFISLPGFDLNFQEIRIDCVKLHQALILHEKGWLLLQSTHNRQVSTIEMAVLNFLYRLSCVSVLSYALVAKMLTLLKSPTISVMTVSFGTWDIKWYLWGIK
jgi:hypothetical protein